FGGGSLFEVLDQVRYRQPEPPTQCRPHVPHDLETICLKCLEKNPCQRYASAADLAADLNAFRQGSPIRGQTRVLQSEQRLKRFLAVWKKADRQTWALRAGYEILGQQERGGHTVLYLARDMGRTNLAVLKVLLPGAEVQQRELLHREAEVLARLAHPSIP